ncbi:unnamed protein product [Adineta ricciae]|uniref:Archaemetzincin-2 n=1 Tax=Adineta ricciae TaxID=249248 RepID=A0A814RBR9_ADIRI|nr:unnamed protein product [Adineta ricciae]CAF1131713.1 unnamed protein product [Adineta ricciae]
MSMTRQRKTVPFASGFKLPDQSAIEKALGAFDDATLESVFNENFYKTFDSLPFPKKPWDWLAQYIERGQTYAEHLQLSRTLNTPASSNRKSIYLTIIGEIDYSIFDVNNLVEYTQRFFQMPVKLIHPFIDFQLDDDTYQWTCKKLTKSANEKSQTFKLHTRYNEKPKHCQVHVTSILNLLTKVVPEDAKCLVALTMLDLYSDDTDLFIAGLARGNSRVAVFSLYRYDPHLSFNESDWFSCKVKTASKSEKEMAKRRKLLLLRACRLLTHEICHLFGIAHCIFYSCLINGSGHLDEDFSQSLLECPVDLRKLHSLIQFDIRDRYEQLLEFFKIHEFKNELESVQTKLNVINQSTNSNISTAKRKHDHYTTTSDSRLRSSKRLAKC